jgi:hypothetical protein
LFLGGGICDVVILNSFSIKVKETEMRTRTFVVRALLFALQIHGAMVSYGGFYA